MIRSSLRFVLALALTSSAVAQQQLQPVRMTSPLRDAGVYHVATGTWSHDGSTANLGPDVIYSATAPSGYFAVGWEGQLTVDEGVLPGTTSPLNGPGDIYSINGLQFGYCASGTSVDWAFTLYDSYVTCDLPSNPLHCINVAGTVATVTAPGSGCWLVTLDLIGCGSEICMDADGGVCEPGSQGISSGLDSFGWGAVWQSPLGATAGPLLSGYDPSWAPAGEGTCYNAAQTCAAGNTGLGSVDLFAIDGAGSLSPGCYYFGGYFNKNGCGGPSQAPPAQFHFELYTDCDAGCPSCCGAVYCDSDPNQTGDILISTCSLSGGPVLSSGNVTGGMFAYYNVAAGNGVIQDPPGSQGQLCLAGGGPIGRYNLDLQAVVGGSFSTELINGNTGGGVGNLPSPPGGQLTAGQTWNFQGWVRIAGGSRWTDAINVTFVQ